MITSLHQEKLNTSSHGFTLIEILIFIVVTSILAATILFSSQTALQNMPRTHNVLLGQNTATACIEGFIAERRTLGYSNAKLVAASPVAGANMPVTCAAGVTANIVATTLNGDTNFKTIEVSTSGTDSMSLSTLIADY